jgi:hypothetical protein
MLGTKQTETEIHKTYTALNGRGSKRGTWESERGILRERRRERELETKVNRMEEINTLCRLLHSTFPSAK